MENINDFVVPKYLKRIDWERLGKELDLPPEQFWALQWLRQRRAEKQAYHDFIHKQYVSAGYKYKEKNGVYYYWKEKTNENTTLP